jgi:hypothetical protein
VEHLEDLYDILGVPPDASPEELHHARNRMLRYWHPDRSLDPLAPERAKRINAAYDVLADPARREVYDQHRAARLARLVPEPQPPPAPAAAPAPTPASHSATATGPSWTEAPWDGGSLAAAPASGPPAEPAPERIIRRRRSRGSGGLEDPDLVGVELFSWPHDRGELWDRARAALPFGGVALLVWLTAPLISLVGAVWLLTLWIFASLFAVSAAVRTLTRRPVPFRRQGWERYGAAWLAGSVCFVLAWQLVVSPLASNAAFAIVYAVLLAAFLAGFGGVYLAWRRR